MQREDIKSGFLQVPPSWLHHLLNKPWSKKQCVLFPSSHQGVKRLEVFDLAPSLRRREPAGLIIPLGDCVKIAQEHHKGKDFVFSVVTREGSRTFAAASIQELREWVDALQRIAFGLTGNPDCPNSKLLATKSLPNELCDDNALYGSMPENRCIFPVTVEENETTSRLQMVGPHVLQVAAASVQLRTVPEHRLRASWLFSHIRRYGCAGGAFVMEVGRSSETGAGSLVCRTRAAGELQRQLQRAMAEYELHRHSAAPDVPTTPPPPPPPPAPPTAPPFESQTLDRLGSGGRRGKKTAVAKPPRKTKGAAAATAEDVLPNVVPLAEKQWLLSQSMKLSSPDDEEEEALYSNADLLQNTLSAPYLGGQTEGEELMYAEPGERRSAWRELGRSVEHVEHMERRSVSPERRCSSGVAEPVSPSAGQAGQRVSASYARLQFMVRAPQPAGAVYARLGAPLVPAATSPERTTSSGEQRPAEDTATGAAGESAAAGETAAAGAQPVYENVPSALARGKSSGGSGSDSGAQKGATSHVVVNDAMYTLLDKPLRTGS